MRTNPIRSRPPPRGSAPPSNPTPFPPELKSEIVAAYEAFVRAARRHVLGGPFERHGRGPRGRLVRRTPGDLPQRRRDREYPARHPQVLGFAVHRARSRLPTEQGVRPCERPPRRPDPEDGRGDRERYPVHARPEHGREPHDRGGRLGAGRGDRRRGGDPRSLRHRRGEPEDRSQADLRAEDPDRPSGRRREPARGDPRRGPVAAEAARPAAPAPGLPRPTHRIPLPTSDGRGVVRGRRRALHRPGTSGDDHPDLDGSRAASRRPPGRPRPARSAPILRGFGAAPGVAGGDCPHPAGLGGDGQAPRGRDPRHDDDDPRHGPGDVARRGDRHRRGRDDLPRRDRLPRTRRPVRRGDARGHAA